MKKTSYATTPIEKGANKQILLDYADSGDVQLDLINSLKSLPIAVAKTNLVSPDRTVYQTTFDEVLQEVPNAKTQDIREFAKVLRSAGVAKFLFPGKGAEGNRPNRILWGYLPRVIWDFVKPPAPAPVPVVKPQVQKQAPPAPVQKSAPLKPSIDFSLLKQFAEEDTGLKDALVSLLSVPTSTSPYHNYPHGQYIYTPRAGLESLVPFDLVPVLEVAKKSGLVRIFSIPVGRNKKVHSLVWAASPSDVLKKLDLDSVSVKEPTKSNDNLATAKDLTKRLFFLVKNALKSPESGEPPAHRKSLVDLCHAINAVYATLWGFGMANGLRDSRVELNKVFNKLDASVSASSKATELDKCFNELQTAIHDLLFPKE